MTATVLLSACAGAGPAATVRESHEASAPPSVATPSPQSTAESTLKIGLVTDVGKIDDPGIDQDSWAGVLDAAQRIGATDPIAVHSETTMMIRDNIESLIDQGANVIVTVGYAADDWTVGYANTDPDVQFIGVDHGPCLDQHGNIDETGKCAGDASALLPNLQGLLWSQQQAGYLAGVVAASISKTGHILTVGRADSPWLTNYMVGYLNGATSVDADAKVDLAYVSKAADEWEDSYDPAAGKAFTLNLLNASPEIDVVFQVAGGQYEAGGYEATTLGSTATGILQAACEKGVYAIGLAVDQHLSLAGDPSATSCLVTSAQNLFAKSVSDAIVRVSDGTSTGGITRLGVGTGSLGLAPFYDFQDLITAAVQANIDAAIAGLTSGSVVACDEDADGACVKPAASR